MQEEGLVAGVAGSAAGEDVVQMGDVAVVVDAVAEEDVVAVAEIEFV